MKVPTREKTQTINEKIAFIERTIQKLGICSINNAKLTSDEVAALQKHFTIERVMGYTRFSAL